MCFLAQLARKTIGLLVSAIVSSSCSVFERGNWKFGIHQSFYTIMTIVSSIQGQIQKIMFQKTCQVYSMFGSRPCRFPVFLQYLLQMFSIFLRKYASLNRAYILNLSGSRLWVRRVKGLFAFSNFFQGLSG